MLGDNTPLNATGGSTQLWSPALGLSCTACFNPIAAPSQTTTYCVLVSDTNNCTDTACVTISVINCGDLFVPTAFSPNNDNINDVLLIQANCVQQLDFKIYDRWGNKVFQSANVNDGWDGTYKGKAMDAAVFVYYVSATLFSGEPLNRKGNISLIR